MLGCCSSVWGQSVWNILSPVRIYLKGLFFETVGGGWGGGGTGVQVDELVGGWVGGGISQCTCNRGRSGVHTNRGNKVLLVQTPGIKMAFSFPRGVVRQLQVGNIQEARRSGSLHTTSRTLFTPRAASTVCGASLALFWVYTELPGIKVPKTEFIKLRREVGEICGGFKLGEG